MRNTFYKKLFFLLTLGLVHLLHGEDLFEKEFENFENSLHNEFEVFERDINKEFTDMLQKNWDEFHVTYNKKPYRESKPKQLPHVQKEKKLATVFSSPVVKLKKVIATKKIPSIEKKYKSEQDKNVKLLHIDFYSNELAFFIDKKMNFFHTEVSKENISRYFTNISSSKYLELIDQIDKERVRLNLNDWATYQLIYKIGIGLHSDKNLANLFSWFTLTMLGYDARVAYSEENIYLLSPSKDKLYQVTYIKKNNEKYYVLTPTGRVKELDSLYTYKGKYPDSSKKLSFSVNQEIQFNHHLQEKNLHFKYQGIKYNIQAKYSKDLIDFYKTYPQSEFTVYFQANNSSYLSSTLLKSLKPLLEGKTEIEAVNFLLRFVQKAFRYKTDPHQFGYEKPLFVEETIFYSYSDCEDRSILFSYLVENLLDLDVVGVKYSDHLATAVHFNTSVEGESFEYHGKNYILSDPTYINANVGMSMPSYQNSDFKVISF